MTPSTAAIAQEFQTPAGFLAGVDRKMLTDRDGLYFPTIVGDQQKQWDEIRGAVGASDITCALEAGQLAIMPFAAGTETPSLLTGDPEQQSLAALAMGVGQSTNSGYITAPAASCYQAAAQLGNPDAIAVINKGELYFGEPKAWSNAARNLETAFEKGSLFPVEPLALAYWKGLGVPPDAEKAKEYWEIAIQDDSPRALEGYANFLLDSGASYADPKELEDVFVRWSNASRDGTLAAASYFRQSESNRLFELVPALDAAYRDGSVEAAARLGDILIADPATAGRGFSMLREAAKGGSPFAAASLGEYWLNEGGVDDQFAGLELLTSSADRGEPTAALALAKYSFEQGDVLEAFDRSLQASSYGIGKVRLSAQQLQDQICSQPTQTCEEVVVGFATNRELIEDADGSIDFVGTPSHAAEPSIGFAKVVIPVRRSAQREQPKDLLGWLFDWVGETFSSVPAIGPQYDFAATQLSALLTWSDFSTILRKAIDDQLAQATPPTDAERIFLFVHGVNTPFRDALIGAARLKLEGNLPGAPIVYSWPTEEAPAAVVDGWPQIGYSADTGSGLSSCGPFASFVGSLERDFGARNVSILAYSHGSWIVHGAVSGCVFGIGTPLHGRFRTIVYAAPDILQRDYEASAHQLVSKASNVTLYASGNDRALTFASRTFFSGAPLAGMGGENILVVAGVDTIDVTDVDDPKSDSWGHAFLFSSPQVQRDIELMLWDQPANSGQRCLKREPSGAWRLTIICQ